MPNYSNFTSHIKVKFKSYQLNFLSPYFMGGQLAAFFLKTETE